MKMCETGVKVEFEKKAFEQIRQNASQVLNSDDAPDVTEYNKGNATSGLLASQGLLTNLNDYVSEYGWDKIITGSLADCLCSISCCGLGVVTFCWTSLSVWSLVSVPDGFRRRARAGCVCP